MFGGSLEGGPPLTCLDTPAYSKPGRKGWGAPQDTMKWTTTHQSRATARTSVHFSLLSATLECDFSTDTCFHTSHTHRLPSPVLSLNRNAQTLNKALN